jgi:type I restriction-modification system DNA methylase subunit
VNWLNNSLLDSGFLATLPKDARFAALDVAPLKAWLLSHYQAAQFAQSSESQLERAFIDPLLTQLGWTSVPQQVYILQGKQYKPDWSLVQDAPQATSLLASGSAESVIALCESKAFDQVLDNGRADKASNPHYQLLDYLNALGVRFGFLTNGRFWRLYDTSIKSRSKAFLEIDLQTLLTDDENGSQTSLYIGLRYLLFFFGKDTFVPAAAQPSTISAVVQASNDFTLAVEENLKAVIYGTDFEDSVFELMGVALYQRGAQRDSEMAGVPSDGLTQEVYHASMVLLFRLLFVVYFEDKNRAILHAHPYYAQHSLATIHEALQAARPERFDVYSRLQYLFRLIDKGDINLDIPLFNGGLFDESKAPLLLMGRVFTNSVLKNILDRLLYKTERGVALFDVRRDFTTMSVAHLGHIYEGLLEFRFEVADEDITYVQYTERGKTATIESYQDAYDLAALKKIKTNRILRETQVKAGEVYLKNASNSRKTSASYYTPTSISSRLVKAGIDHAIAVKEAAGQSLWDLKILDNACGSGHFLVESLHYLSALALERLPSDPVLKATLDAEKARITTQLLELNLPTELDDAQVLRRALLKRCIFGVDLNPFAVELSRLSLWIDTFIFGTPLSFIEHHVQHGNALMGSTIDEFLQLTKGDDLFQNDFSDQFKALTEVMIELDHLQDSTTDDIKRSKHIFEQRVYPRLRKLGRDISLHTMLGVMRAEGVKTGLEAAAIAKRQDLKAVLKYEADIFDDELVGDDDDNESRQALRRLMTAYSKRHAFFHYEVSFPEANGFDVIVGNPPWDKTKFSDTDFFPQYKSNYRSLSNSEKQTLQTDLLAKPHVARAYEEQASQALTSNAYYKAHFPLNAGSGDGNLFRFFVERNLSLLAPNGTLCYVLPSALMFEEGSLALRKHILENQQLKSFYSFENNDGVFPDVHRSYKFAMMQIVNSKPEAVAQDISTAFYLTDPAQIDTPASLIPYGLAALRALSPNQLALMECRSAADLPILAKCYEAFKPLSPDWLDFRRELDMTNDKDLFVEQKREGLLPLFEGKMIWQYSANFGEAQYWLDPVAFDERTLSKELHRMASDLNCKKSELTDAQAKAVRYDRGFYRIGFRGVASDTNERTLVFGLIPKDVGAGNSLPVSIPKSYGLTQANQILCSEISSTRLLFSLAVFNSLTMDWLARFMIQMNVNQTYLYRLPVPQPTDAEIAASPVYKGLVRGALLLTLAGDWDAFAELAIEHGITKADLPKTDKQLDLLRVGMDKAVAKLYGITDAELAHMLTSFKVLARKRPDYVAALGAQ